ncbi:hypothetical protein [Halococcus hamelinensis]|uniref:DNA replication factor GINS n=1 Tax=Halococcus hamelinensis 100A6 TaxID=1132509 RepID=M0LYA9_9EURY|nr:hypothetical protein [Halococcus hamelinensis]EMA38431.1 hypothetical protein C447_09762 [Halococcus hamelinensis 100A6]
MDLGDLQSARSKERQRDSLQHLHDDFYADVGSFVAELRTERERAAAASDDPFDAPEVRRLTDDIKAAENTVEAVYERRVGKLVKLASLAAAGMPAETDGLTDEESDLFGTLVNAIESNREHVLDDVLAGDRATGGSVDVTASTTEPDGDPTASGTPDTADATGAVESTGPTEQAKPAEATDSVDVGAEPAENGPGENEPAGDGIGGGTATAEEGVSVADAMGGQSPQSTTGSGETSAAADRAPAGADDAGGETPNPDTDRTTVRITQDVGEVFGVDEQTYHLSAEDVVTLPEVNATPLVERDAAEQLD